MADDLKVKVNGKTWPVEASPDTPLLYVLSNELGSQGTALRLRPCAVRLLLGAGRRRRDPLLHHPGGATSPARR